MHPPSFLLGNGEGVGGEPPNKSSKKKGAWQDLNFKKRKVAGKEGVTFSRVGCCFYIKSKLKSEIFYL